MHLLQKYLKVKYRTQSDEKLLKLMDGLENLHQLSAIHFTNYSEVPPEYIGPLLREMLDTRESCCQKLPVARESPGIRESLKEFFKNSQGISRSILGHKNCVIFIFPTISVALKLVMQIQ
ncbi:unnamed protein product [Medioppia subpectinata]|uniref:Uncharacterized protein n=1 Tax=Medioppia subpectinata TaxID=1979941 RepID=A0A7R9Q379_9ACAR|nr:unnamed protein product [Medioppia subpectinata]CAG2111036.1 unnamed protein product [Medioppia subpectinata]